MDTRDILQIINCYINRTGGQTTCGGAGFQHSSHLLHVNTPPSHTQHVDATHTLPLCARHRYVATFYFEGAIFAWLSLKFRVAKS